MVSSTHSAVNVHYLDHVMTVAEERQVEATEDIYAENGIKLVARGYAITRAMRDRLLEHKLTRPLEDCLAISDGVTGPRCAKVAQEMLDAYPVLRAIVGVEGAIDPIDLMAHSTYSGRLQTLLTVYNEHRPGKLAHAVRVSLLALSLMHRASPRHSAGYDVMLLAALAHDIGELYIDPAYLAPGARIGPKEWRHISAHPIIAHGLLKDLGGLAEPACALILDHHERLDGFGYPQGKRAGQLPLRVQVLSVAEMLAGILERGDGMLQQADIAVKLIQGEFSRDIIQAISTLYREHHEADQVMGATSLQNALQMSRALGVRLGRILAVQDEMKPTFDRSSQTFKTLWFQGRERFESILRAWSSTGLDVQPDGTWLLDEPPEMQREVAIILKEISWRLRELERELHSRTTRHAAADLPMFERYLLEVRQRASEEPGEAEEASPDAQSAHKS